MPTLTNSGYHACPCRDCFETAIGCDEDDRPDLCHECESAGCEAGGDTECSVERMPQPDFGDWVTEDFVTFKEYEGSRVVRVADGDDWRETIGAVMRADRYWPNIWRQDDHGGIEPVSEEC